MAIAIIAVILFLDQLTKFIATRFLAYNQSLPVIKGVFHLTLIHNTGAAFGILKNQTSLFIFSSITAIILIYFGLKDKKYKKSYKFSLSLILAGALGNLIDRISLGYVVDFLDFRVWPVFNLADSAITVGAILLGVSVLKKEEVKA